MLSLAGRIKNGLQRCNARSHGTGRGRSDPITLAFYHDPVPPYNIHLTWEEPLRTPLFFCLALLLPSVAAQAQAEKPAKPEPIVTDRPDFTESALVVPHRRLQVENGFTQIWGRGYRSFGLPEILFRYGLTPRLELRFAPPNYTSQREDGQTLSGFGDTYLGFKCQIGPLRDGTDVALIPAAFFPSGSRAFSTRTVDPEIKLCASRDLNSQYSLNGMFYFAYPTEDGRRNATWQTTLSLGHPLTERLSCFLEFSNVTPTRGAPENLVHAGFAYLLTRDQQIDLHFGFGLNAAAPRALLAAGYSVRF